MPAKNRKSDSRTRTNATTAHARSLRLRRVARRDSNVASLLAERDALAVQAAAFERLKKAEKGEAEKLVDLEKRLASLEEERTIFAKQVDTLQAENDALKSRLEAIKSATK